MIARPSAVGRSFEGPGMSEFQWYEDTPRRGTAWRGFFMAPFRRQTWANILYLALSFPLGVAYFTVLVTVIATGGGMAVTLVGIPLLVGAMYAWPWVAEADRILTNALLGSQVPPLSFRAPQRNGAWQHIRSRLASPATWLSLIYLLARLPQGVAALVALSVFLVAPAALATTPGYYWIGEGPELNGRHIDTLPEALLFVPVGIVLVLAGFHVLNWSAYLSRRMTEALLTVPSTSEGPDPAAGTPSQPVSEAVAGPAPAVEDPSPAPAPSHDGPGISVDVAMRLVTVGGEPVELTRREFDLLALFAANPGRPFSRDELLDRVWKGDYDVTDRTIDTHVQRLRKKLGPQAEAIQTVWGVGYRFRER